MDKPTAEVKPEVTQEQEAVIPVSKAKELMEKVANSLADRLLGTADEKPKEDKLPDLSPEAETMVKALSDADTVKASIRKDIAGLPSSSQVLWLKAYTLGIERTPNDEKARKFAWSFVKPEEQKEEKVSSETPKPTEVAEDKKEEVMAAEVKVKADANQNMKGGEVTGFQSGESASSGPKGNVPTVPGKVLTEGPALDVLPKPVKTGYELKTDHEAMAAQADKAIEALKRGKGMLTEKSKLASTMFEVRKIATSPEGLRMVESFVAYAKKKSKISPKAKDFISKKIQKVEEEGKNPEQAAGQAYGMARQKGYKVPEKKGS